MPSKSKTKAETKTKTKLLMAVCKRAGLMRAPFRVCSYPSAQIHQTDKKPSSNNEVKQKFPVLTKHSKEKTKEKVSTYQFSKYSLLINIIHIDEVFSEMTFILYSE